MWACSPEGIPPLVPGMVWRLNPSGYPESQGAFAERVRRETESRLDLPCRLEFGEQREFPEPPVRINTDLLDANELGWNDAQAWDELMAFLRKSWVRIERRVPWAGRRGE
jgi:UDP-glucose 4-epimerase